MQVEWNDVKEDYARKDAKIEALKQENENLKAANGRLTHGIFFSEDEFMTLATFAMVNDTSECTRDIDVSILHSVLDQIAINHMDYNDWIEAYHALDNPA